MHGAIRNRLEDILRPERAATADAELKHLSECGACSSELAAMREQAEALRALKGPNDMEVPASFYAGVLRVIEENRRGSIWASLIYSPIGTRLVYASLAVAILVGGLMIGHEERDGHLGGTTIIADNSHYEAAVFGDQAAQRDAVLTNFASR